MANKKSENDILTQEELDEDEIIIQSDAICEVVRLINDPLQSVLYKTIKSKKLNKKVVTKYDYIEEIENEKTVGRSLTKIIKTSQKYNDEVLDTSVSIIGRKPIERK